jgi:hypothetical protein
VSNRSRKRCISFRNGACQNELHSLAYGIHFRTKEKHLDNCVFGCGHTGLLGYETDDISWFVINCGALLDFVLDHPVILDFDKRSATLWDGGEGSISLSDVPLSARAVSAVLKQPDRVVDHRVKVHGGIITQNQALEIAQQASAGYWTAQHAVS